MIRTLKQERQFWIDKVKYHVEIKTSLMVTGEELENLLLVLSTDIDMA